MTQVTQLALFVSLFIGGGNLWALLLPVDQRPQWVPRLNFNSTECHPDRKTKPYVHDPVALNECYACHQPIGSDHDFGDISLATKTCSDCHEGFVQPVPRTPDQKTHTCASCHHPHDSTHPKFLKMAPEATTGELCLSCHKEFLEKPGVGHHPVQQELKRVAQKQLELSEAAPVDCLACHDIHRSQKPFLLKQEVNKLCSDCHDSKLITNRNHTVIKEGAQHEQGCLNCHQLHAGLPGSHLLRASKTEANACLECHDNKTPLTASKHDLMTWNSTLQQKVLSSRKLRHVKASCQVCHGMHESDVQKNHLRELASVYSLDPISNQCLSCHRNQEFDEVIKQVKYYSHPNKILSASLPKGLNPSYEASVRFFSMLGEEIKDNRQAVTLSCGSCHNPHVWSLTSNTPVDKQKSGNIQNSFLINNQKTMMLCAACHGEEALVYYSTFHSRKVRKIDIH